jgi:hypothetical protein
VAIEATSVAVLGVETVAVPWARATAATLAATRALVKNDDMVLGIAINECKLSKAVDEGN